MNKSKYYILAGAALIAILAINRAIEISRENAREIFNTARYNNAHGEPVEVITAQNKTGTLKFPVAVRYGRILVSSARVNDFKVGQTLTSGGVIVNIARRIDLDTGLLVITAKAPSGNTFVRAEYNGAFVPLSAIHGDKIMIAHDGRATERKITVIAQDMEHAVIRGVQDGEEIILTAIEPNTKIRKVR
ncbi:MAG: hypothetical protein FWD15_03925 [Alphaproteobacteria bacterium]|nr:hypothetical protein [Alphaproteobacteria bacterium]